MIIYRCYFKLFLSKNLQNIPILVFSPILIIFVISQLVDAIVEQILIVKISYLHKIVLGKGFFKTWTENS